MTCCVVRRHRLLVVFLAKRLRLLCLVCRVRKTRLRRSLIACRRTVRALRMLLCRRRRSTCRLTACRLTVSKRTWWRRRPRGRTCAPIRRCRPVSVTDADNRRYSQRPRPCGNPLGDEIRGSTTFFLLTLAELLVFVLSSACLFVRRTLITLYLFEDR